MKITKILLACLPGIVCGGLFGASTVERAVSKPNVSATSRAKTALGKLPLSFQPNRGQTDPRVQFLSRGPGYTVFFTKDETVLSLKDTQTSNAVVRMKFVGGTGSATATPVDALPGPANYLVGSDASKWITNVAEYTKLRYENVYPGIDVLYQGDHQQLRYDFIVKPGASASAIQMAFEGADNIAITKDGDLALTINGKTLITKKPFTYQEDNGTKREVASHYVMQNGRVAFELASYDTTKAVVIDPTVVFVTFLGGLLNDSVNGVAILNPTQTIASQPSAYFVAGTTTSPNFPTTSGVVGGTQVAVNDVFVTKISFNGATILWSTYLGGNSNDSGNAVAVDSVTAACVAQGCPVVVGQTFSANFPTVPFQTPGLTGTSAAFVSKLATDGKSLIYSAYVGGTTTATATGVTVNNGGVALNCQSSPIPATCGDTWVGGYTDSPYFFCPGNVVPPTNSGGNAATNCTNSNHTGATSSSDAFVVRVPAAYPAGGGTPISSFQSTLYGGFGEEFAHGIAYNPINNMVYLAGDTTTAAQNFVAPNNVNLPTTNNTGTVGIPGPGPNARAGFVVAFDGSTLVRTFSSYVSASPNTGSCGQGGEGGFSVPCNLGTETISGIAAEGGAPASCSATSASCTTSGNIGHVYITGATTSHVNTGNIAAVVPNFACINSIIAASTSPDTYIGPSGTQIVTPGAGKTTPSGCVTSLTTQAPFNFNYANTAGCSYPVRFDQPATSTCNFSAFVAILDGALLPFPVPGAPYSSSSPIGNQVEYWAYYGAVQDNGPTANPRYSSPAAGSSSTVANAIAIDTNPTTLASVYSLGTYQQMYITGGTTLTSGGTGNTLPVTNNNTNPQEIFTTYNAGTSGGGGVGGYTLSGTTNVSETDAFIARFNPNGVVASAYGGFANTAGGIDRSPLIHTPQFNFGEFLYSGVTSSPSTVTPSTVGNAIAVDPTRAALIGGSTNNVQTACASGSCAFTTTNNLGTGVGNNNQGGNDGWVSVLFFNDILTDASSVATANPFLQPGWPQNTNGLTYIQTTPAPFGPTFDFAISDPSTQTQSFRVLFTGQASGQLLAPTPWFVPLDSRYGATVPTLDNGLPGSGIVYYLPCQPSNSSPSTLNGTQLAPAGSTASGGYYNNGSPAPGGPYAPLTNGSNCPTSTPTSIPALYTALTVNPTFPIYSGWPGIAPDNTRPTPGWLLVSQDINPGVVRLALDRRAAAGLLEGTYVAQFLVSTYDSQNPAQWPPCGVNSSTNLCTNQTTPHPADNHSILVTVRLVVRPSLFLSRNAGFLTGVTTFAGTNATPPAPGEQTNGPAVASGNPSLISTQQGTTKVPDWLYTGAMNDTATNLTGTNGINSGPAICVSGTVPAFVASTAAIPVPCPVSLSAPQVVAAGGIYATYGATAYAANGPGDLSGGPVAYSSSQPDLPTGSMPNMTFYYDSGTVQSPNLSLQMGLPVCRQDAPGYAACIASPSTAQNYNADFQGGVDPATQRNDATVHDYYVTVEGGATISVGAINCTHWTTQSGDSHVGSVGNWLGVQIGGTGGVYTPICTDLTPTTIGTQKAPATGCSNVTNCTYTTPSAVIGDDNALPPNAGGQQIPLDFKAFAFSNRAVANGIPTGIYTAQVYVWSTRAKNSVPGYCLGASMPATVAGLDPRPLCGPNAGTGAVIPASSSNPNPEVQVLAVQTFTVTLSVFDTTQVIQITPNICPAGGISSQTWFATVANSENLQTGNGIPPFGSGSLPNYPTFGPNADALVVWSLLPFQTTGGPIITGCIGSNSGNCVGPNQNGPNTLQTVPLPNGVTVNAQTLADYNSCKIPTGTFNGQPITGASVPGLGSLTQVGPISQTTFNSAYNGTTANVVVYACRPTVAPAWLNSTLYPGLANNYPGSPEPYSTGNGNSSAPVPSTAFQVCPLNPNGTTPPVASAATKVGVFRNSKAFLLDSNGNGSYDAGTDRFFNTFTPPGGSQVGDVAVAGDWTGDSHFKVGIYRPATGQWFLDTNNNGTYDAGTDATYNFGGLAGDVPVVGDWAGLGKSCVGVFRQGGFWLLDLNCNGTYDGIGPDTFFPFGGVAGDVPVVGAWTGGKTRVGVVRKYAPGGIPLGNPFLWVLDSADATAGTSVATHQPAAGAFGFGGLAGDVFVAGDWGATGTYQAGVYRNGLWIMDTGSLGSGVHSTGSVVAYGGVSTDQPITGKW